MTIPEDPGRYARVRLHESEVLSHAWYTLKRVTYDYQRSDGAWVEQRREVYDRGNGATILLRDETRDTVLLTRQFRMPAYLNGHPDGMLIETPAGLLDGEDPETAIRREAEEETGYRVDTVQRIGEYFMSPGSVTERIAFFTGSYRAGERVSEGGGVEGEGEDIEVLEVTLAEALAMIDSGEIIDAKTVLLLRLAQLA
ncbi:MAG TPA: NUDIX domain-containing protein [Gaiellales bacterium]|nr:NUDIX domain-containing protein [Gaiellales bacterium]